MGSGDENEEDRQYEVDFQYANENATGGGEVLPVMAYTRKGTFLRIQVREREGISQR